MGNKLWGQYHRSADLMTGKPMLLGVIPVGGTAAIREGQGFSETSS